MVMAKIKVSQATIDKIKAMGMTKALKGASGASPEMKEALTRMYGARRVAIAAPAAAVSSTRRKYGTPNATSKPVMVDAKGPNAVKPAPTKTMYNRATGAKVTYTETPKAKAKPKAPVEPPKYNRLTGAKIDYTTKPASTPKPKAKKPVAPAPKYNRYTQQKVK
jgi:hypothetical protein